MGNYLWNIKQWLQGWLYFDQIMFKDGWSNNWQWKLLYLVDHGACVILLAGAIEPISHYAQRHRKGRAWDFLLDLIERFDPGHGLDSGGPLWASEESPKWVRIAVPTGWSLALWLIF